MTELNREQITQDNFNKEVITPLADKIIGEITSNNLTNKQINTLITLVMKKIENLHVIL